MTLPPHQTMAPFEHYCCSCSCQEEPVLQRPLRSIYHLKAGKKKSNAYSWRVKYQLTWLSYLPSDLRAIRSKWGKEGKGAITSPVASKNFNFCFDDVRRWNTRLSSSQNEWRDKSQCTQGNNNRTSIASNSQPSQAGRDQTLETYELWIVPISLEKEKKETKIRVSWRGRLLAVIAHVVWDVLFAEGCPRIPQRWQLGRVTCRAWPPPHRKRRHGLACNGSTSSARGNRVPLTTAYYVVALCW